MTTGAYSTAFALASDGGNSEEVGVLAVSTVVSSSESSLAKGAVAAARLPVRVCAICPERVEIPVDGGADCLSGRERKALPLEDSSS